MCGKEIGLDGVRMMLGGRRYEDEAKYKPKMTIEREKGKGKSDVFCTDSKVPYLLFRKGLDRR